MCVLHLQTVLRESRRSSVAFTRDSFTSRLLFTNQPSVPPPPPPTCIAHPSVIPLHDHWTVYDSLSQLAFVYYTPYHIGDNNIVSRPSSSINKQYMGLNRRLHR